jgi:hypothetical protein
MFGYDVAQRRLMGREVLAASFQSSEYVGWIGFFEPFLRVASRHAASFRTDT